VNVAVILRGWTKLLVLRGYRGNGAFVCGNTAVVNGCTLKSEVCSSSCVNRSSTCIGIFRNFATSTALYSAWSFHCNVTSKSQQWTKLGQVARGLFGIPAASTSSERSWLDCE